MTRVTYREDEIEQVLLECAMNGGYLETTVKSLTKRQDDLGLARVPDRRTIRSWTRDVYRDRYEQIRAEIAPKVRAEIAEENVALAHRYAQAEHLTLDKVLDAVDNDELDAKDLVNLNRNLATSKGIAVDKYDRVSEQGGNAVAKAAIGDALERLTRRGLVISIPGAPTADYEAEATEDTQELNP